MNGSASPVLKDFRDLFAVTAVSARKNAFLKRNNRLAGGNTAMN